MGEIEGDGDAGRGVGAEPFAAEPDVGAEGEAFFGEFGVEAVDAAADFGAFDFDAEVAEAP